MAGILDAFSRLLARGGHGKLQGSVGGRDVTFIANGCEHDSDGDNLSIERLWATEPNLRNVVDFIARSIAQLSVHTFRSSGDANERVYTGPVVSLMKRPNDYQTAYELFYALVMDLALYDKAYLATLQDPDKGWQLHVIPASWVSVTYEHGVFSKPTYEAMTPFGGAKHTFQSDEILPWHGWTPGDPECSTSPIESLRLILSEQRSARKHRTQLWKNNGRFGTFFTRPKEAPAWQDTDRKRFMEMIEAFTGNRGARAGAMPLLEDGITPVQVGFKSADEEWSESVRLSLETVAQVFHVNPTMVGVLDNANYSNVREFRQSLYRDSLGPVIVQIQQRLNAFLLPRIGAPSTQFVEFNVEGMLRGSFEEQSAVMQAAIGGPWMTRNEGRRLQNLAPIDGGDELIVPLNIANADAGGAMSADELAKRVTAAGALIRGGFVPEEALAAAGLDPIAHLGLLPVTVRNADEGTVADPEGGSDEPTAQEPAKARLVERIKRMGTKTASLKADRLAKELADDSGMSLDDASAFVREVLEG